MTTEPGHGCAPGSDSRQPEQQYDPISQQFTDYVGSAVTEWALGYLNASYMPLADAVEFVVRCLLAHTRVPA